MHAYQTQTYYNVERRPYVLQFEYDNITEHSVMIGVLNNPNAEKVDFTYHHNKEKTKFIFLLGIKSNFFAAVNIEQFEYNNMSDFFTMLSKRYPDVDLWENIFRYHDDEFRNIYYILKSNPNETHKLKITFQRD